MTIEQPIYPGSRTIAQTVDDVVLILQNDLGALSEETLTDLHPLGRQRQYQMGDVLCRQGEQGDRFFIILEGEVTITQTLHDGADVLVGRLQPGQYFGELSLLDDMARTATCTAVTTASVLELTRTDFQLIVKNEPTLAVSLLYRMLRNLRENNTRAYDALLEKNSELKEAYAQLQAAQADLLRHERQQRDLEIAAEMQRSLLPDTLAQDEKFAFAAYLGSVHLGGNFYDVMPLNEEYIAILLGDVAERGVQAALQMAVARTLFVNESKRSYSPFEVVTGVNQALLNLFRRQDVFIMAVYGLLHLPTGIFSYIIAGNERPLLVRPERGAGQLTGRGSFLGQTAAGQLRERRIRLISGDRLVLFSRGVVDSMNTAGEPFGLERLQQLVERHLQRSAEELVQIIQQEIWIWQAGSPNETDFALLVAAAR